MTRTKRRTVWVAVAGERDRSFDRYTDACAWLDKVSPETATRGFETEDRGDDEVRPALDRRRFAQTEVFLAGGSQPGNRRVAGAGESAAVPKA